MTFAIEKNIPLAPVIRKASNYPFALLEVGDSFFVPATAADYHRVRQHVASYAHRQHTVFKTGKYCTRKAEGGLRVWRTA